MFSLKDTTVKPEDEIQTCKAKKSLSFMFKTMYDMQLEKKPPKTERMHVPGLIKAYHEICGKVPAGLAGST